MMSLYKQRRCRAAICLVGFYQGLAGELWPNDCTKESVQVLTKNKCQWGAAKRGGHIDQLVSSTQEVYLSVKMYGQA